MTEERLAHLERQFEAQQREIAQLKAQVRNQYDMTVSDVIFMHPLKHAANPGVRTKMEAGFSLGGRVLAGYGIYRLVSWGIGKAMGA